MPMEAQMDKREGNWIGLELCFLKTCQPNSFSNFIFVVCYVDTMLGRHFLDSKLWFCHSQVISQVPWLGTCNWHYKENEADSHGTAPLKWQFIMYEK